MNTPLFISVGASCCPYHSSGKRRPEKYLLPQVPPCPESSSNRNKRVRFRRKRKSYPEARARFIPVALRRVRMADWLFCNHVTYSAEVHAKRYPEFNGPPLPSL